MSSDESPDRRPARRPPPRRARRRSFSPALVALCVAAAFLVGAGVGYLVRGAPESEGSVTVERSVPVVTVTVEAPP